MSTKLYTQILHMLAFVFVAVLTGLGTIALDTGLGILGTIAGFGLGLGTSYVAPSTTSKPGGTV